MELFPALLVLGAVVFLGLVLAYAKSGGGVQHSSWTGGSHNSGSYTDSGSGFGAGSGFGDAGGGFGCGDGGSSGGGSC